MKLHRLSVSNFMRIAEIDVDLSQSDVVTIGGRNGQGKSSLISAIAAALGGARLAPEMPIKAGEKEATITVDLGQAIASRRFWIDDQGKEQTRIEVKAKDGATYGSAQAMLDQLLGNAGVLVLDPTSYLRQDSKKQLEALKKVVGLDFTEADSQRKSLFDQRSEIHKELDRIKAKFEGEDPGEGVPEEELRVSVLSEQLEEAIKHNARVTQKETALETCNSGIEQTSHQVNQLESQLQAAKEHLAKLQADAETLRAELTSEETIRIDVEPIRAQIADAEETNRKVRAKKAIAIARDEWAKLEEERVRLNVEIDAIDEGKRSQLAQAKFPVEGLSFGDDEVLLSGIPLSQCSSSEQQKVTAALALAMAGEINLVLLQNASLLDEASLAEVRAMASGSGAQLFLELVGEGDGMTLVIEDGRVKGAEAVAA